MARAEAVTFSQDLFDTICARIADGESMRQILSENGMPSQNSVYRWLANDAELSEQYTRAREIQAHGEVDEIKMIADHATPEDYNVARLKIDARKWRASKLAPKKYGEKTTHEHSGPDGGEIPVGINVSFK